MKPEYTLEESVDFAVSNEAEDLKGEEKLDAAQRAYDNAYFYADQYGYPVEDFKAGLVKRGATPRKPVNPVTQTEIIGALKNNCFYVYAKNQKFEEFRITAVKTKHGLVYGRALSTGKWFVINSWESR